MSNNRTHYRKAAGLVRQGWAQKCFVDPDDGGLCTLQAVAVAMRINTEKGEIPADMVNEIFAELTKDFESTAATYEQRHQAIYSWNDADYRTVDDVLALFDRLAGGSEGNPVASKQGELVNMS